MELTRRGFVAGLVAASVASAAALGGCQGRPSQAGGASATGSSEPARDTAAVAASAHNPASVEEYDVVVVGSGTAGTVATARAAQLGLSVLCLEKNPGLGGTSVFAEGFCGIGSKAQAAQNIVIDPAAVVADTMSYHHNGCLGPVVRAFVGNSGETVDWLEEFGTTWASIAALGESYQVWHLPAGEGGMPTSVGSVLGLIQEQAQNLGAEFRTGSPATGLVVEDGAVRGVYAKSSNGEIQVNAKAVILASGGYANNADMFERFTNKPYDSVHVWGMEGRDGDGITFATTEAGAAMHHPEAIMWHTGMLDGTDAFSDIPNYIVTMQPTMRVNEAGARYFNEATTSDFTACGNALTVNAENYAIFDDAFIDHIETEGPWMPMPNLGAFAGKPYQCREGLVSCPGLVSANAIEELAQKLGLDGDALVATVERFNAACAAGVDEEFSLPANMLLPVSTPPYYGAKITPTLFTTVGGLRVNLNMQVMGTDGKPVEGLFAAGGDAAGLYGANYDVDVCSGSQQGWAATSGRLAAEFVAANLV